MYHQYRLFTKLYYDYLFKLMVLIHQDGVEDHKQMEFLDSMLDSILNSRRILSRTAARLNENMSKYHALDAHFREIYKNKLIEQKIELP